MSKRIRWAILLTVWLAVLAVGLSWVLSSLGIQAPGPVVTGVAVAWAAFIWSLALWPALISKWVGQLLRPTALGVLVLLVVLITAVRVAL
jgi:hypothetical protein